MRAPIIATYRVQLHRGFTFDHAAAIADYFSALGISHIYCSPYLQAVKGSTHGYDVVDHRWVNEDLGGEPAFSRFVRALAQYGLSQVLDVVPNHMAISAPENRWWHDVLENGPSSYFAAYFDVEWDPPEARLRNMVLLPVLGDQYGRVLEAGEITLIRRGGSFDVRYGEHEFPIDPRSTGPLLAHAAERAGSEELASLATAFASLPRPTAVDRVSVARRHRDVKVFRQYLDSLLETERRSAAAVDDVVAVINADPDQLHDVLEAQNYRLAWWRSAGRDLGYRRFFDINTLIGLRMEDPQVFADTHARVIDLARQDIVQGLRVDHPDGLRDPEEYFERLHAAAPEAWIVAEKILQPGEPLPESWPVAGTTGYDFLTRVSALFNDPEGEAPLTTFYGEFTRAPTDYAHVVRDKKRFVLREVLGSDVNRLTDVLLGICERQRRHRDYTRHQLTDALREVIAAFPVYRTYVRPSTSSLTPRDRQHIARAIQAAASEQNDIDPSLFSFIESLLVLELRGQLENEFVCRFQQLSAPAMAKGAEDTAFYTYNRFIALNEVGGDPSLFAVSLDAFHDAQAKAQREHPAAMLTLSTHDTKRSGDVRARLSLLSECPDEWTAAVGRWAALTDRHRTGGWSDRNVEYFFYQTLAGAWPLSIERAVQVMEKSTREAKEHTSWTSPNEAYDTAVKRFVEGALADEAFLADVAAFVEPLVQPGRLNALAQTLLLLTSPGIPDLYQGTELWALQLVDPDNRGPVNYDERREALKALETQCPCAIRDHGDTGLPKLWVIRQALQLRRRRPAAFGDAGAYTPLRASGPLADRVVAFQRGTDVITVVPRLVLGAKDQWHDASLALPAGRWRNVLAGKPFSGVVTLDELWRDFPVALLEREDRSDEARS